MKQIQSYSNVLSGHFFNRPQGMARLFQGSIFLTIRHVSRNTLNHINYTIKLFALCLLLWASLFKEWLS